MLNIGTENKGIRFLLSCLLFRIWRGDFDKDFDESFEKTPLDWELSEDGPEAHYLKILYKRRLDFHLVKSLFTQTVSPHVCDVMMEDTIFERLIYGGFRYYPSPEVYELIIRKVNRANLLLPYCLNLDKMIPRLSGTAGSPFVLTENAEDPMAEDPPSS